jgi:hypothetical protein
MLKLIGLTLEVARAELGDVAVKVVETAPPLGPKSPLVGATEGGEWRVLRARKVNARQQHEGWELLVAREQTRA